MDENGEGGPLQTGHMLAKELGRVFERVLETVHLEKYMMSCLAVVPYWC